MNDSSAPSDDVLSFSGFVFSIRLFPEITIKSPPVRKRLVKHLSENLRTLGRQIHPKVRVIREWDRLELRLASDDEKIRLALVDLLARTPGIANFSEVKAYEFSSLHDIYEYALSRFADEIVGKTFCVRVKRTGKHDFTSTEIERYVGGGLHQHVATGGVRLKDPQVVVQIEVKDQRCYMVDRRYEGLGGFPVGTQDAVLSLVSGGFDSTVASYMMMRRGLKTHFCFFNLGGRAHELGVKEIAYYLWRRYGASHRVRFITVPFDGVVAEILDKVGPANMGVVLKRMMLRAADSVAEKGNIQALVTGEAIAQVSSQTIPNLAVIDQATEKLVLRPLISTDKTEIIKTAREIGAEEFSANIPEYCGVISVRPSAKVKPDRVLEDEGQINFSVLDKAIEDSRVQSIDQVMDDSSELAEVETLTNIGEQDIVVDIRHPDECELKPMNESWNAVHIPFYKLSAEFAELDNTKQYLLYCDKGVMSELHAAHLKDEGYKNVAVFRPDAEENTGEK